LASSLGLTLPPNCVAQGARRERTLRTCYAYLPRTEIDRSCPFFTSDREENARIILESMVNHGRDIDNLDPVEELMIDTTLRYYERSITELALFTDYALAYLHQDGWILEALPDPELAQKQQKQARKAAKDSKFPQLFEDQSEPVQLILQGLMGVLTIEEVADIERRANAGGLVDLVGANAAKVVELLRRAGLHQLCDGTPRAKDDPDVIACGVLLQSREAVTLLKQSNALDIRASRSKATDKASNAVKTIRTVMRQLGGELERCGKGRSKVKGELPS